MKIPFVDLYAENKVVETAIFAKLRRAVKNSQFILSDAVGEFENNFARFCGVKFCVGVSSGTDALHMALRACGITKGDEVITTPVSYTSTSLAIVYCGAKPVYVDVLPNGNIDPSKITAAITKKTKAILVVHMYGDPCDLNAISKIAKRHKLFLIDDCAHAHGARYRGKPIGGLTDISCFSFYPSKNLGAWGDAGAVTTNNRDLEQKVRLWKGYGEPRKNYSILPGYNNRIDSLQAIVLNEKLKFLDRWNKKRKQVARRYATSLVGIDDFVILPYSNDCSYYVFPVKTNRRDRFQEYLSKNNISTIIHYPLALHLQPCFKYLGYKKGDFPMAENHAQTVISLPLHPTLSSQEQEIVFQMARRFFNGKDRRK